VQASYKITLVEMGDQPKCIEPVVEDWSFDKPKAVFTLGQEFSGSLNFWRGVSDLSGCLRHHRPVYLFNELKHPISKDELSQYHRQIIEILRGDCKFEFGYLLRRPPTD